MKLIDPNTGLALSIIPEFNDSIGGLLESYIVMTSPSDLWNYDWTLDRTGLVNSETGIRLTIDSSSQIIRSPSRSPSRSPITRNISPSPSRLISPSPSPILSWNSPPVSNTITPQNEAHSFPPPLPEPKLQIYRLGDLTNSNVRRQLFQ